MLGLLKRYLSPEHTRDAYRALLPNYSQEVELIAYCLMPNHYHFLFYLKEMQGIERLMRSVMTAYSRYFNTKYKRVGGLFQNRFLASHIGSDEYLWHVSRYIHLNPMDIGHDALLYRFSSIRYYKKEKSAAWLHEEHLVESGVESQRYIQDLRDESDYHSMRNQLKHLIADS